MTNPHMLPKVRSEALMASHKHYECELRLASFVGLSCSPQSTVVGCHVGNLGKGTSTKVSDLFTASGCSVCHSLLDRTHEQWPTIYHTYPTAGLEQIMRAVFATQSKWIGEGLLMVPDGRIV